MKRIGVLAIAAAFLFVTADLSANWKCKKGNCKNGSGVAESSDGRTYKGKFKDGKPEGKGVITYKKGPYKKFTGTFKKGKKHGKGTMLYKNGQKFEGKYKDGKRHGSGKIYGPKGKLLKKGKWNNGKLVGK